MKKDNSSVGAPVGNTNNLKKPEDRRSTTITVNFKEDEYTELLKQAGDKKVSLYLRERVLNLLNIEE